MSLVTSLYAYRSLTDRELGQYIAFWASGAGASMAAKTGEAINAALEKLAADLGDISGALLAKYPPQK